MSKKDGITIQPLADRVLLKEIENTEEQKTASGIIIPASAGKDSGAKRAKVVAVGPGKFEDGELRPINISVGDEVLFSWGDEIKVGDETYHIVSESNILAVIK